MVTMFANLARENTRSVGEAMGFPGTVYLFKTCGELVALFQ
jgi:hypothetical protein